MGFWQGIDVPGRSLALVTIDRLPFPRPDEPLLQARRERARADAFRVVDLPRAATMLAQGAGRLIRTADRPRCRRGARPAAGDQRQLPVGHRVRPAADAAHARDRAEAEAFLAEIAAGIPDTATRLGHDEVPEAAEATDERRRTPT